MSGSAALSAARKRRASTAPSGPGGGLGGPAPTAYYGRGAGGQSSSPGLGPGPSPGPGPSIAPNSGNGGALPPQPMNIYENIELIKHQLSERTKLIQSQGSSMPPEKVRVLQKQNEIQMQILKQKMAIAAQMENENQSRGPPAHIQEPEFFYEKGVPRKNPNYRDPNDVGRVAPVPVPVPVPTAMPLHASKQQGSSAHTHTTRLSPFVSMLSDTGVIPPPVVVLKAHDIKLQEHNHILHDIVHELEDLRASMMAGDGQLSSSGLSTIKEESRTSSRERSVADENAADEGEDEPEELLMEVVMNDLTNSREFVEGIVNKIVNETNLSEVIMKIEPLVKENQELRSLIHSQQQMMNEMNTMLLRLLNGGGAGVGVGGSNTPDRETVVDGDGLFPSCEMTEIILSGTNEHVIIGSSSDVNVEAADEAADEAAEAAEAEEAEADKAEAADEADEAEEAEEAAEAEEADEAEAGEAHESDETRTLEPTTDYTYDEYDKRHFIEPISLVVSEL